MRRMTIALVLALLFVGEHQAATQERGRMVPLAVAQPDVISDETTPAEPVLRIKAPKQPRAGTRVVVTVEALNFDKRTPVRWSIPDLKIEDEAGTYTLTEAIVSTELGRRLEIVWPRGDEVTLVARASKYIKTGETGEDGLPIIYPVDAESRVTFTLVGGVGPVTPDVPSVPTPTAELQARFAELKEIAAAPLDKSKKATMVAIWYDFSSALATAPVVPKTTGTFKQAVTHYSNAAGTATGLAGAFPGFSAALEKAFVATFGDEDAALDKAKAVEFSQAIAWACGAK